LSKITLWCFLYVYQRVSSSPIFALLLDPHQFAPTNSTWIWYVHLYFQAVTAHIYIHTLYITYIYNIEVPHQILPAILSNRCLRVLPPLPHHVLWKPMPSAPPVITMFKKVGWLLTIPRKMGGKHDIVLTTWYIQIPLKSSFLLIRYH
jgi:hypothetical protein